MKYTQKWLSKSTWGCPNHIPMARIPASHEKCWFCAKPRPPLLEDQVLSSAPKAEVKGSHPPPKAKPKAKPKTVKKIKPSFTSVSETGKVRSKCAWRECVKTAAVNSKYCSRNCSNKNARARHKVRNQSAAAE
jgi:hypothetical protein